MSRRTVIAIITCIIFVQGCKTKFYPEKPVAEYVSKAPEIEKIESYLSIPVEISLEDLEKQVNTYLKGRLYEDNSFTNNENDGLVCIVKKYSDIKIESWKNAVRITAPLDVWGKYKTMGVTTEFKGVLAVTYNTSITIMENWKMVTNTWPGGHEWIRPPTIDVLSVDVPVTYIADAILNGQQEGISKEIDKAVKENIDLKALMKDAITGLYEPMLISEEYKSWLRIQPTEIMLSQINSNSKKMKITLGLRAYMETIVGEKPAFADTTLFPSLHIVEKMPDEFNVGLVTIVKYADAAKLMNELYVLQPYTYAEGKKSITLTHFDMWAQGDRMVMEIGTKGSLNGFVYLIGTPYYEEKDRTIRMKDVDFHLDTKNKLIKSANWLLHGTFAKVMQKNIYFEIGKELDATKKDCQSYFNNYECSEGVFLNGKLNELEAKKVYLVEDGIVAVVNTKGKLSVKIGEN